MEFSEGNEQQATLVEQRSAQRFGLALRLTVEGEEGATHDLSTTGLCFDSAQPYQVGSDIEFVLECPRGQRVTELSCVGQVVRVTPAGDSFNIAVKLLSPLDS
jgi:hypothetical protein